MKKVFGIIVLVSLAFFAYNNIKKTDGLVELHQIPDYTEAGGGDSDSEPVVDESEDVQTKETVYHSQEANDYFTAICQGSEYGSGHQISKWESDVKVYVMGTKVDYLMSELKSVVSELNSYIDPINIKFVNSKSEANFVVVLGSAQDYINVEPFAADFLEDNWGLFVVNSGSVIYEATMYVDIERCTKVDGQKHLLREEFTQALGFKKDSHDYPESMFYQGWTTTTEYAPIDVEIIKMLYNE